MPDSLESLEDGREQGRLRCTVARGVAVIHPLDTRVEVEGKETSVSVMVTSNDPDAATQHISATDLNGEDVGEPDKVAKDGLESDLLIPKGGGIRVRTTYPTPAHWQGRG